MIVCFWDIGCEVRVDGNCYEMESKYDMLCGCFGVFLGGEEGRAGIL